MNELLEINTDEDIPTVSARDLHSFLNSNERFSKWFERMISYGFVDGVDFTSVPKSTVVNNGAVRELDDYQLTIECGKLN